MTIARRYLLPRSLLDQSMDASSEVQDSYVRAGFVVVRRVPVLRWIPSGGRARSPLPDPASIDPWAHDPSVVPELTRRICDCMRCHGDGEVRCAPCRGSTRVDCVWCWGDGRTGRDDKKCWSCNGRGHKDCSSCTNGRVTCGTCAGSGAIEAWIDIEIHHSQQVRASSAHGPAAGVHGALFDYADFDAGHWPNQLLDDRSHTGLAPGLGVELLPTLAYNERATHSRVQHFAGLANIFPFRTSLGAGTVEIAGVEAAVARSSRLGPLRLRRALLIGVSLTGLFLSFWLASHYVNRHAWFAQHGCATWVQVSSLLGTFGATWTTFGLTLASPARSRTRLWIGAPLLGLGVVLGIVAWNLRAPSAANAVRHFTAQRLDEAALEANAVRELGIDPTNGAEVLDAIHMRRLESTKGLAEQRTLLQAPWLSTAWLHRASAWFVLRVKEEANEGKSPAELRELATWVAPYDAAQALELQMRAALGDAELASRAGRWSEALRYLGELRTQPIAERLIAHVDTSLDTLVRARIASTKTEKNAKTKSASWDQLATELIPLAIEARVLAKRAPAKDWPALEKLVETERKRSAAAARRHR